jgi:hypothetical protein
MTRTLTTASLPTRIWSATALAVMATLLFAACAPADTADVPPPPTATAPSGEGPQVMPPEGMRPGVQPGPGVDIDWSTYPIIVDGTGLELEPLTVGDAMAPTHVPVFPVAAVLGSRVDAASVVRDGAIVTLDGLLGPITFTAGSADFDLAGASITLDEPSVVVDGILYVPLSFFRDVFGAAAAYWLDGHVHIETTSDMS